MKINQREIVAIGKECKHCGKDIKARYHERNWALRNKEFCSNRCGNVWKSENRDNMQATAAMRSVANSDEVKAKRLQGLLNSPKRATMGAAAHSEEAIKKANASRRKIRGFQSVPENFSAKWWRVRDCRGRIHEFKNLSYFIRNHADLFLPEDVNWKNLLKSRAYGGICSIRPSPNKKKVNGTWKGWTWYSQTERLKNEGNDLLDRKSQ